MDSHIKVFLRARPTSDDRRCVRILENNKGVDYDRGKQQFFFDGVFDTDVSQEAVFSSAGVSCCDAVLRGYNACVFAYGQTGSGKTYTMQGEAEPLSTESPTRGLLPRAMEYLFSRISSPSDSCTEWLVDVSCLEIYNEQIFDLLSQTSERLQIREKVPEGVYVEGLQRPPVGSASEAFRIFRRGVTNRHVAETSCNRVSSRSHAVFTVTVQSKKKDEKTEMTHVRSARLHLIDLAGSERQESAQSAGQRLKEAGHINQSLSHLGNVISTLSRATASSSSGTGGREREPFVNFRNSKLTFLLRETLGGNSMTTLIATVDPSHPSLLETLSTLQFASRAKKVQCRARVNEAQTGGTLETLKREVIRLKELLEKERDRDRDGKGGRDTTVMLHTPRSVIRAAPAPVGADPFGIAVGEQLKGRDAQTVARMVLQALETCRREAESLPQRRAERLDVALQQTKRAKERPGLAFRQCVASLKLRTCSALSALQRLQEATERETETGVRGGFEGNSASSEVEYWFSVALEETKADVAKLQKTVEDLNLGGNRLETASLRNERDALRAEVEAVQAVADSNSLRAHSLENACELLCAHLSNGEAVLEAVRRHYAVSADTGGSSSSSSLSRAGGRVCPGFGLTFVEEQTFLVRQLERRAEEAETAVRAAREETRLMSAKLVVQEQQQLAAEGKRGDMETEIQSARPDPETEREKEREKESFQVSTLQRQLKEAEQRESYLRRLLEEEQKVGRSLRRERETALAETQRLRMERGKLREELTSLESDRAAERAEADGLRERVEILEAVVKGRLDEVEMLEQERETAKKEKAEMERTAEKLRNEITALRVLNGATAVARSPCLASSVASPLYGNRKALLGGTGTEQEGGERSGAAVGFSRLSASPLSVSPCLPPPGPSKKRTKGSGSENEVSVRGPTGSLEEGGRETEEGETKFSPLPLPRNSSDAKANPEPSTAPLSPLSPPPLKNSGGLGEHREGHGADEERGLERETADALEDAMTLRGDSPPAERLETGEHQRSGGGGGTEVGEEGLPLVTLPASRLEAASLSQNEEEAKRKEKEREEENAGVIRKRENENEPAALAVLPQAAVGGEEKEEEVPPQEMQQVSCENLLLAENERLRGDVLKVDELRRKEEEERGKAEAERDVALSSLQEAQATAEQLGSLLQQAERERALSQQDAESLQDQMRDTSRRLEELRVSAEERESELLDAQRRAERLETEVSRSTEESARARQEAERLMVSLNDAQKTVEKKTLCLESAERERDDLFEVVQKKEREAEEIRKSLETFHGRVEENEKKIQEQAAKRLDALNIQVVALQREVDRAGALLIQKRQQVENLESSLAELQQSCFVGSVRGTGDRESDGGAAHSEKEAGSVQREEKQAVPPLPQPSTRAAQEIASEFARVRTELREAEDRARKGERDLQTQTNLAAEAQQEAIETKTGLKEMRDAQEKDARKIGQLSREVESARETVVRLENERQRERQDARALVTKLQANEAQTLQAEKRAKEAEENRAKAEAEKAKMATKIQQAEELQRCVTELKSEVSLVKGELDRSRAREKSLEDDNTRMAQNRQKGAIQHLYKTKEELNEARNKLDLAERRAERFRRERDEAFNKMRQLEGRTQGGGGGPLGGLQRRDFFVPCSSAAEEENENTKINGKAGAASAPSSSSCSATGGQSGVPPCILQQKEKEYIEVGVQAAAVEEDLHAGRAGADCMSVVRSGRKNIAGAALRAGVGESSFLSVIKAAACRGAQSDAPFSPAPCEVPPSDRMIDPSAIEISSNESEGDGEETQKDKTEEADVPNVQQKGSGAGCLSLSLEETAATGPDENGKGKGNGRSHTSSSSRLEEVKARTPTSRIKARRSLTSSLAHDERQAAPSVQIPPRELPSTGMNADSSHQATPSFASVANAGRDGGGVIQLTGGSAGRGSAKGGCREDSLSEKEEGEKRSRSQTDISNGRTFISTPRLSAQHPPSPPSVLGVQKPSFGPHTHQQHPNRNNSTGSPQPGASIFRSDLSVVPTAEKGDRPGPKAGSNQWRESAASAIRWDFQRTSRVHPPVPPQHQQQNRQIPSHPPPHHLPLNSLPRPLPRANVPLPLHPSRASIGLHAPPMPLPAPVPVSSSANPAPPQQQQQRRSVHLTRVIRGSRGKGADGLTAGRESGNGYPRRSSFLLSPMHPVLHMNTKPAPVGPLTPSAHAPNAAASPIPISPTMHRAPSPPPPRSHHHPPPSPVAPDQPAPPVTPVRSRGGGGGGARGGTLSGPSTPATIGSARSHAVQAVPQLQAREEQRQATLQRLMGPGTASSRSPAARGAQWHAGGEN